MRYELSFALCIVVLTAAALATFNHISGPNDPVPVDATSKPSADTLPTPGVVTPAAPTKADYARYADADQVWRESFAHQYTIAELRDHGDGRRTPRDSVQDRAYKFVQNGQRRLAITELERWVKTHPGDGDALLSLARLLNEEGRSDDAIGRYRQLLALHPRGE